jgi:hypothetical protein
MGIYCITNTTALMVPLRARSALVCLIAGQWDDGFTPPRGIRYKVAGDAFKRPLKRRRTRHETLRKPLIPCTACLHETTAQPTPRPGA